MNMLSYENMRNDFVFFILETRGHAIDVILRKRIF